MKKIILVGLFILAAWPAWGRGYDIDAATELDAGCKTVRASFTGKEPCEGMTGNWWGARHKLEEKGITPISTYVFNVLANPVGGKSQCIRYNHSMGWDLDLDLEKIANYLGSHFHISGLWRQGENLSTSIGNDLVVSTIFGHQQFRFYSLYLESHAIWDNRVSLKIGRIAAGDDFASSPLYWTFVSNSIDGNPINVPINLYFSCYPVSAWGARIKVDILKDLYIQSAIYDGDPNAGSDDRYGLDFSFRLKKGIAFAQEIAFTPCAEENSTGYPGHYKAGIYYNSASAKDMYADGTGASCLATGNAPQKYTGNYNLYFHADQLIYRPAGRTGDKGLIPLVVAAIGPSDRNKFPFLIMSGLIYKGILPNRPDDTAAFQVVYAQYSRNLAAGQTVNPQRYEMVFEWTYKAMITKFAYIQPDIQFIVNPGGGNNLDNALVIGWQSGLTF